MNNSALIETATPYDFRLSLRSAAGFGGGSQVAPEVLRIGARIEDQLTVLEVRAVEEQPGKLLVSGGDGPQGTRIAGWVLFADLDLKPFYQQVEAHPVFGPLTKRLYGLKPMRPASLLEIAITVITEQQISLAAAYKIRARLVERFGDRVEDLWVFPTAERLARASLEELKACGLSTRKAEYIRELAQRVEEGSLDLEGLKDSPEARARETLLGLRGFGPWSADYFLVRGLARPNSLPVDDLAVQTVVGKVLGNGSRSSSAEVTELLAPFSPYRGLAAFYLLAGSFLGGAMKESS